MVVFTNRKYAGIEQERSGQAVRANVASPTGGLNTRDAESGMEATDAVVMENVFPAQGNVTTRKGYSEYATGLTGDIETLAEYNAVGTRKFICANADEINDITAPASISNLGTGFSNARWQTVSFGTNMLLVNGADTPQVYDGSSLANSTISGSGLTPSSLTGVNIHKNRLYAWDTDTQDFWYGATNAIGGTFTKFPLGVVAPNGGNLISMMTWNHDGGDGVDDYALFLMDSGTVLLYDGSDPGDANNWSLIGVYKIGRPMSVRGAAKVGGDVAIQTDQDFVFFSQVFKNDGAVTSQSKLSGAALEAVTLYESNYGWEVAQYPKASVGGWLLFNVPVATNTTYHQYVINTITGAATKFTGMNARTWGMFNNRLYFGESTKIMLADDGLDDNGDFIVCDVQSAYSDLGSPAEKVVNSFRNVIAVDGNVTLNTTVNFDFGQNSTSQDVSSESTGSPWDVSAWDVTPWSPENTVRNELIISSGEGSALGMRIKASLKGQQLKWFRTDYSVNVNNIL
jgi:hypothetical protein